VGCTVLFVLLSTFAEIENPSRSFSERSWPSWSRSPVKHGAKRNRRRNPVCGDTDPVSVGRILKPIGTRDEWYGEMLEGPGMTHGLGYKLPLDRG
jgi:hypothetical protein